MTNDDRLERAREPYPASAAGDRATVERILSDDFTFLSPVDGRRSRNTEILTFAGERISAAELGFGRNLQ